MSPNKITGGFCPECNRIFDRTWMIEKSFCSEHKDCILTPTYESREMDDCLQPFEKEPNLFFSLFRSCLIGIFFAVAVLLLLTWGLWYPWVVVIIEILRG